jgi:hypothetical protein
MRTGTRVSHRGRVGTRVSYRGKADTDVSYRGGAGPHVSYRGGADTHVSYRGRADTHVSYRGRAGTRVSYRGRAGGLVLLVSVVQFLVAVFVWTKFSCIYDREMDSLLLLIVLQNYKSINDIKLKRNTSLLVMCVHVGN